MPWTLTSRFWFRRWFPVCSDQEAVTASTRSAGSYPHALVLPLPPLYTCRSLVIEQANQVRTPDITCVPMAPGWVYLVAMLDWASHRVLAHRDGGQLLCWPRVGGGRALGAPQIVNTDQGS
jgi:hypothetical protein